MQSATRAPSKRRHSKNNETTSGAAQRSTERPKRHACVRIRNIPRDRQTPAAQAQSATGAPNKRRHPKKQRNFVGRSETLSKAPKTATRTHAWEPYQKHKLNARGPGAFLQRTRRTSEGNQQTNKLVQAQRNAQQSTQYAAHAAVSKHVAISTKGIRNSELDATAAAARASILCVSQKQP